MQFGHFPGSPAAALRLSNWRYRGSGAELKFCELLSAPPEPIPWRAVASENTRINDMNSRGFPSLAALLGLVAIAGYQNRDKLAELLRGAQTSAGHSPSGSRDGQAPTSGNLGGLLGGTSVGGLLGNGLKELIDSFKSSGHGEIADSWVRTGPNKPVSSQELERAIDPEILATLSAQTGLSKQELLARLSRALPEAVDKYTPDGRLPAPA
jgi:uncharacterized protein YidB (DUF937 family)